MGRGGKKEIRENKRKIQREIIFFFYPFTTSNSLPICLCLLGVLLNYYNK
jgi:hypothetical protein